tara:strand:- start:432 stop:1031 length:600 start_codon:yes stop_codon:yes gene_type:complete
MLPMPFNSLPRTALKRNSIVKGDILFRQNDSPAALFFLQSGHMQLLRHTENGESIIIHNAFAGQTFAEASLFSSHYHCDALAVEPCELVCMDKARILQTMQQNALFALALSARFAGQIQAYRRRLELLAIRSADQRVFAAIADGMLTGSVKSLAAEIGLTHEATYRTLAKLTARGALVKTGRGTYQLASEITQDDRVTS